MRSASSILQDFVGSVSHQPGKQFDRMKPSTLHHFPDAEPADPQLSCLLGLRKECRPFHLCRLLTVALQEADDAINQIRGDLAVGVQHGLQDPFRVSRHNLVHTAATWWSNGGSRAPDSGVLVMPIRLSQSRSAAKPMTSRAANHLGALGAGSPTRRPGRPVNLWSPRRPTSPALNRPSYFDSVESVHSAAEAI